MGLKERLQGDLTESIRSRDELRSGTIRMVLTAITNEEVSGKVARTLTDAEIITVLSREAKKRREASEAYEAAGRADRAEQEKSEGVVIAEYLPQPLTEVEIRAIITKVIEETGASGQAGMGLVMKGVSPQTAGKADGGTVSRLVKEILLGQ